MTTSTQQLDAMIERVRAAQAVFARYDQEQVDAVFHHAAAAATSNWPKWPWRKPAWAFWRTR